MNVSPVSYQINGNVYNVQPDVIKNVSSAPLNSPQAVMSKEDMQKLMDLVTYNQLGMAEKLVRIASQLYAGTNIDFFG